MSMAITKSTHQSSTDGMHLLKAMPVEELQDFLRFLRAVKRLEQSYGQKINDMAALERLAASEGVTVVDLIDGATEEAGNLEKHLK